MDAEYDWQKQMESVPIRRNGDVGPAASQTQSQISPSYTIIACLKFQQEYHKSANSFVANLIRFNMHYLFCVNIISFEATTVAMWRNNKFLSFNKKINFQLVWGLVER